MKHTRVFMPNEGKGVGTRASTSKGLAAKEDRNIILVTATPHSGKEAAFRSLISLLNSKFADYPEDLTGKENEHHRRSLLNTLSTPPSDIKHFLDSDTVFPDRDESEITYQLSKEYKTAL